MYRNKDLVIVLLEDDLLSLTPSSPHYNANRQQTQQQCQLTEA